MAGIFLISLALRFWGLSRFNTLVFDEVYYARFASHFLKHEDVFTGHPPLSTYIIAFGIWVGEHFPQGKDDPQNALAGLLLSPFSYRWLNALTGSFIPLLVAGIAYTLSNRRSYAFLVALLVASDGLFLVESRYALNNVYLILFGLLGQLFFLLALRAQSLRRWQWLSLAGVCFGASTAIKWNGLGFLLGAYLIWIAGWILHGIQSWRTRSSPPSQSTPAELPLQNLTQLHLGHILLNFAIIPALTYYLCWVPYDQLDPTTNFWDLQLKTLEYHERVGGLKAHPYCSLWFTWPLMIRPIAYFYKTASSINEPVPVIGPPLPQGTGTVIYDVHAMGNPVLWWFSTAAIVIFIGLLAQYLWQWITVSRAIASANGSNGISRPSGLNAYGWIVLYLLLNWAANLLPWLSVTRCLFLYHYMESLVFALLALALILDRWFHTPKPSHRAIGITVIFLIVVAFVFWMPLYLGLPLSPEAIHIRRWFPSWI